jgi:hypothetical protein
MMEIVTSLILVACLLILIIVIVKVIYTATRDVKDYQGDMDRAMDDLGWALFNVMIVIPFVLLSAAYYMLQHVSTYKKYYLGGFVLCCAGYGLTHYQQPLMQVVDRRSAMTTLPFYTRNVMPVLLSVRNTADIGLCWFDGVQELSMSYLYYTVDTLVQCEIADFTAQANALQNLTASPSLAYVDFVNNKGLGSFNFYLIVQSAGDFVSTFTGVSQCMCKDMSFATNFIFQTIASKNFSRGVNDTLNAALITTPRLAIRTLVQLFQYFDGSSGYNPFDCASAPDVLLCKISRPPKFEQLGEQLCSAFWHFAELVDETLYNFFSQFFTDPKLPKVRNFISPPLCTVTTTAAVALDVITHVDLVFEDNYLAYANISAPVDAFHNITLGFSEFFDPMDFALTTYTGNMLRYGLSVPVRVYNMTVLTLMQTVTNFTNVPKFIADYDYAPLTSDWNKFLNNTGNLIVSVNGPLGRTFIRAANATQIGLGAVFGILSNIPTFETYMVYTFIPRLLAMYDEISLAAIHAGDFWRQFDTTEACPHVEAIPNNRLLGQLDGNFFCCLGGIVQSTIQNYVDYANVTTIAIYQALGNHEHMPEIVAALVEGLENGIMTDSENMQSTIACMASTPFVDQCQDGSGVASAQFDGLFMSLVNLTSIPARGFLVAVNVVVTINGGSFSFSNLGNVSTLFCYGVVSAYDLSMGNIANVLHGVTQVLGCLIGGDVNQIGNSLWKIMGWDGSDGNYVNIRDLLCELFDAIVSFINDMIQFMQTLEGAFMDIICFFICAIHELEALETAFSDPPDYCFGYEICGTAPGIHDCSSPNHGKFIWMEVAFTLDDGSSGNACHYSISIRIRNIFAVIEHVIEKIGTIFTQIFSGTCVNEPQSNCQDPFNPSQQGKRNLPTQNLVIKDYTKFTTYASTTPYSSHHSRSAANTYGETKNTRESSSVAVRDDTNNLPSLQWGVPVMTCNVIYSILNNESMDVNLRLMYAVYAKNCMYSTVLSGLINTVIGYDILTNETFLDLSSSVDSVMNVMHILQPIITYVNATKSMATVSGWIQFCDYNNITNRATIGYGTAVISRFVVPMGSFYNTVLMSNTSLSILSSGTGSTINYARLLNILRKMTWNIWINEGYELFEKMANSTTIAARRRGEIGHPISINQEHPLVVAYNTMPPVSERVSRMIEDGVRALNDSITEPSDEAKRNRRSLSSVSNMFKRDDGSSDLCVDKETNCVNCTILRELAGTTITVLNRCIAFADTTFNVTATHIYPPQNVTLDPKILFNVPLYSDRKRSYGNIPVLTPVSYVTNIDLVAMIDQVGAFMINTNSSDSSGALYWIDYFGRCNYDNHIRCDGPQPGFGLLFGFLLSLFFYVFITIVISIFISSIMGPLMILWFTFPFAVLTMAYMWTPMCGVAIPLCTIDDVFKGFAYFSKDCIQWQSFLPGLTDSTCPTAANNYTRPFVDCDSAPYNFNNGPRTLFAIFEATNPSINHYLRTTNLMYLSWIRDVYGKELTFDFPPGQMPDVYKSCMYITSPNLSGTSVYTVLLIVLIIVLLFAAYQLFLDLVTFITVGLMILIMGMDSTADVVTEQDDDHHSHKDEGSDQSYASQLQQQRMAQQQPQSPGRSVYSPAGSKRKNSTSNKIATARDKYMKMFNRKKGD